MHRVLFVAVGEEEVQAYRFIADRLRGEGYECRVLTWLPRLATNGVESLYALTAQVGTLSQAKLLAESVGFSDLASAADFDRDWYFASTKRKRAHVARMILGVADLLTAWKPDTVVSAVGGETLRVVAEALSKEHSIRSLYFNAVPIGSRFVLLPSMASAFVPKPGESGYLPDLNSRKVFSTPRPEFRNRLVNSRVEWLERGYQVKVSEREVYPRNWFARKISETIKGKVLSVVPTKPENPAPGDTDILYPMHDERDFQVAVRERHAVPQVHLLKYVASTLPPGFKLWIKPHPQHLAAHHQWLLRVVHDTPNIGYLAPKMSFQEAISKCDVVFTLASTLGFESLKLGKPVVCYGTPFYSGYGITTDVRDPREISKAIQEAVSTTPPEERVNDLIGRMHDYSWQGKFTPLALDPDNLDLLAQAVFDVIRPQ